MKTVFAAFAAVASALAIAIASPAMASGKDLVLAKTGALLACEKACHDDHRRWVDQCIASHDPREITPSARGQCVDAGAERLQQCLRRCR